MTVFSTRDGKCGHVPLTIVTGQHSAWTEIMYPNFEASVMYLSMINSVDGYMNMVVLGVYVLYYVYTYSCIAAWEINLGVAT